MVLPKKLTIFFQVLLVIGLLSASAAAYYFYSQYKEASNVQAKNDKEAADLKTKVAKLLVLPVDEEPVIATVTDKTKLEQQAFFQSAENGDKVLIYQKASKVVLYRPSQNKIVDITALNVVQQPAELPSQGTVSVAIYNGTSASGLAATVEQQLKSSIQNLVITSKSNASTTAYSKTVVVNVSNKYSDKAIEIANKLGVTVSSIPSGETAPQADILVIVGSDKL